MAKKVKKNWAYVKGHYRKNGTWVPPHLSLWRQLVLPMCVAGVVWFAVIYLLFGLVVLLALAVFSVALCICIIVGKCTLTKFIMGKVHLKKVKESRLKLYEELCSKLKKAEIFEDFIDIDKLSKNRNRSQKKEYRKRNLNCCFQSVSKSSLTGKSVTLKLSPVNYAPLQPGCYLRFTYG